MKRNLYPLIFILIVLITGVILLMPRKGEFRTGDFVFPELDTSRIESIIITPAEGGPIQMTRENSSWILNDSFQASPVLVNNMLFILKRMVVKGIADSADIPDMEFSDIIFNENREVYRFRFLQGGNAEIINIEEINYFIEVSGFPDLRFSQVFSNSLSNWRDNSLLSMRPETVFAIDVQYPSENFKSFTILKSDNEFRLYDPFTDTFYPENATLKSEILMFSSYFMDVFFDSIINEANFIDSVFERIPEMKISLENKEGENFTMEIWPISDSVIMSERYKYARKNGEDEVLLINQVFTDLWSKQKSDFLVSPVENEK
jgi:hypothetical protein